MTDEEEDRKFPWYLLLTLAMGGLIFWLFGAFRARASDVAVFGGSAHEDASIGPFILAGVIAIAIYAAYRFVFREDRR